MDTKLNNTNKESIDLRHVITTYLKHWKWFVLCIVLALVLAFFKIRYSTPEYNAVAVVQIIEDNTSSSELSAFKDLEILAGVKNKIEDEVEAIASRSNFVQVVKNLKLNVRVETIGKIINTEIYDRPVPFHYDFLSPDSVLNKTYEDFYIEIISENSFGFSNDEDEPFVTKKFGEKFKTDVGEVQLDFKKDITKKYVGVRYRISLMPVDRMAAMYKKKVNVKQIGKLSNIVNLSVNSPNKKKGRDILNTLIMTYNDNAIANQKYLADKTSEFIDNRITGIYSSLTAIDSTAENLMENRGITDIATQSSLNMQISAQSEQELQATQVQLDIANSMVNSISNDTGYNPLVSNLNNAAVQSVLSQYNDLAIQRKKLLETTGQAHPRVIQMTKQMNSLKTNIISNARSAAQTYSIKANNLSRQLAKSQSKLYSTAGNSRALNEISRDQDNMASVYQYLIRKREEAQIKAASTSPKCNIIDSAYNPSSSPVSPKKPLLYLTALIMGALVPFSVIYARELLDNKLHSKQGLEKLINFRAPVIAEIPSLGKQDKLIRKNDRSVLAESLRILRTNLDYLIKPIDKGEKANVIYVTSSISGEGKTFLASNISLILAKAEKKVLLIGADVRNPKLHTILDIDQEEDDNVKKRNRRGLTDFLSNKSIGIEKIIHKLNVDDTALDIMYSGKIPPNPSELLMNKRLELLLDEVSLNYDYVIVDTAPMVVVTDTLLISDYADQIIYVTRAGFTETSIIQHPVNLMKEEKIKNLSFVVNDVKQADLGYGGKYGYGYGVSDKKWWQFFRK